MTLPAAGRPAASGLVERWVGAWMRAARTRPRTALAALGVAVLAAAASLPGLSVDTDSSRMIAPDLPDQQRAHAVAERFPALKQGVVLTVTGPDPDTADAAAARIAAGLSARDEIADVFAPSIDPFFAANGVLYGTRDEVAQRLTRLSQAANLLATLRTDPTLGAFLAALDEAGTLVARAEIAPGILDRLHAETAAVIEAELAGQPRDFAWSSLLEPESTGPVTRILTVTPHLDTTRLSPARPALDAIAATIRDTELPPGVTTGVTGEPALRAEELRSVSAGIGLSLGLSLVLVAVLLRIGLRSTRRAAAAFAALVVSLVLTTGVAAGLAPLNLISVAFVVLMVGLGIDFAIHVLAHLGESHASGLDVAGAVDATAHETGLALTLSAATTTCAFLAFAVTDFAGMAQLGLIGAAGVPIAFAVAITVLPALSALVPGLLRTPPVAQGAALAAPAGSAAAIVVLAAGAVLAVPALDARFDADPIGLRDPQAPSVIAFRALTADPATTPYRVSVLARDDAEAAAIKSALAPVASVGEVRTLSDLIPSDQPAKLDLLDLAAPSLEHAVAGRPIALTARGGTVDALAERLAAAHPGTPLAAALTTYGADRDAETDRALEARIFRHFLPMISRIDAMLDAGEVTRDDLPAPLRARFVDAEGVQRVDTAPASALSGPAELAAFARAVSAAVPEAAGGPVQLAAAADTVGAAMLRATLLAGLVTLIFAIAATRHAGATAAIVVPLLVAGIATAAFSALSGIPFNYANVIVLPLMIGLGVDSGIHLALRAMRAEKVGATSTPRAVLFSALTTLAAFGTLALSDHRGTASMGILLTVAMVSVLVSVFALTPAMIRWTGAGPAPATVRGSTERPRPPI